MPGNCRSLASKVDNMEKLKHQNEGMKRFIYYVMFGRKRYTLGVGEALVIQILLEIHGWTELGDGKLSAQFYWVQINSLFNWEILRACVCWPRPPACWDPRGSQSSKLQEKGSVSPSRLPPYAQCLEKCRTHSRHTKKLLNEWAVKVYSMVYKYSQQVAFIW